MLCYTLSAVEFMLGLRNAMRFLEIRTPRDMLEKARRERARLSARIDVDNVFNFFVTAYHVKDYIEKSGAVPSVVVQELYSEQDMRVRDCRDLCDKAKHLKLTRRADPDTHKWSGAVGGAPIGAIPLGSAGYWELWSGERHIRIVPLASRVMARLDRFFVEKEL